ncbi:MAG TPA: hypothetical protein VF532_20695 [Candidatus Angelobacter sp.]
MRDISQQMERLTRELRELRLQLQRANSQTPGAGEHSRVVCQVFDATLVSDLTDVVTQLSHFLWRYIDSAARPAAGADLALQSKRLEKATAMLRRLRCASSPKPAEDPAAFVARVTRVVDRVMEGNRAPDIGPQAADDTAVQLERSA